MAVIVLFFFLAQRDILVSVILQFSMHHHTEHTYVAVSQKSEEKQLSVLSVCFLRCRSGHQGEEEEEVEEEEESSGGRSESC